MRSIIDTNIAILLRDGDERISERIAALPEAPLLSILSRVELEGGVYRDRTEAALLRARVDAMLGIVEELPFATSQAVAYGRIVEQCGFSRALIIDRMIAAQAIVADALLITLNARDFRTIPGLELEDWSGQLPIRNVPNR